MKSAPGFYRSQAEDCAVVLLDRLSVGRAREQRIGHGPVELDSVVTDAARLIARAIVIDDEGHGDAVDGQEARIAIFFLHLYAVGGLAFIERLRGQVVLRPDLEIDDEAVRISNTHSLVTPARPASRRPT